MDNTITGRVKALEWGFEFDNHFAKTPIGIYTAFEYEGRLFVMFRDIEITDVPPASIPHAKAAAQSHYEQLVRSCVEPVDADAEMVELLEWVRDTYYPLAGIMKDDQPAWERGGQDFKDVHYSTSELLSAFKQQLKQGEQNV